MGLVVSHVMSVEEVFTDGVTEKRRTDKQGRQVEREIVLYIHIYLHILRVKIKCVLITLLVCYL